MYTLLVIFVIVYPLLYMHFVMMLEFGDTFLLILSEHCISLKANFIIRYIQYKHNNSNVISKTLHFSLLMFH